MRKIFSAILLILAACSRWQPVDVFPQAYEVRFYLRHHDEAENLKWLDAHPQGIRLTAQQVKKLRSTTYIETNGDKLLTACAPDPVKEFDYFDKSGKKIGEIQVFEYGSPPEISPQQFDLGPDQYFEVDLGKINELVDELNNDTHGGC